MSEKLDLEVDDMQHATDKGLRAAMQERIEDVAKLQKQIQEHEQRISHYQAILDYRALERFWDANPTLPRLKVGDKLVMTDACFDTFNEVKRKHWEVGAIAEVTRIYPNNELHSKINKADPRCVSIVRVDCDDYEQGYTGQLISVELTPDMRRAYLQQQEAKQT